MCFYLIIMDLTYVTAAVVLSLVRYGVSAPGDPVMYLPPFEVRTLGADNRQVMFPFTPGFQQGSQFQAAPQFLPVSQLQPASEFQPVRQHLTHQEPILHTSVVQTPPVSTTTTTEKPHETKSHNLTLNDFVEALNEISEEKEERHDKDQSRAAGHDHEYTPYPSGPYSSGPYPSGQYASGSYPSGPYSSGPYPSYSRPYGPYRPSYGPAPPYHEPAAYVPPTSVHHPVSKTFKPDLSGLLKPVATKAASKVSGLLGLVLSLFSGSGSDGLELKGLKDIVINGIIKPLLIAKGGIKSLISKLTIPLISLLLINLEVLITVWWLWEDCPEPTKAPPVYPYPKPANGYNSYR